jgi:hypothetical protein
MWQTRGAWRKVAAHLSIAGTEMPEPMRSLLDVE